MDTGARLYWETLVCVHRDGSHRICVQLICYTEILELCQHIWVLSVQGVELVKSCSITGWNKRFSL
jgi:hypothetical protein